MISDFLVGPVADLRLLCGLLAALLSVIAFLPYIVDTATGRTRPERATWLIWSLVSFTSMCGQIYEGADRSLWFVGVQVSATVVVFLMSIQHGFGTYVSRRNVLLFGATVFGMILWWLVDDAIYMLVITTVISAMGGSVTVVKAYQHPGSETLSTWVISLAAAFFAILSLGSLDLALLIYPVYLYLLYATIIVAILAGRIMGNEEDVSSAPSAPRPSATFGTTATGVVVH